MENITYKNITRLKNTTNNESVNGKAYLDLTNTEFILHYPNKQKGNIMDTETNELIALYQSIGKKRYLTHLVRPIDKIFIDDNKRENYRYGRRVKVIGYTGEENKILFKNTLLAKIGFRNMFGDAREITKLAKDNDIEAYQKELWDLFQPFFKHGLNTYQFDTESYFDKEQDIEVTEGSVTLKQHLVKERNNTIIRTKKELALLNGNSKCEVCGFSFMEAYGQNYIECHHIIPIYLGERITKLEDLALVCSNCHRMLHRQIDEKYLSVQELKLILK